MDLLAPDHIELYEQNSGQISRDLDSSVIGDHNLSTTYHPRLIADELVTNA